MKREIICVKCKPRVMRVLANCSSPPNEHAQWTVGRLKFSMVCDDCNAPLPEGTEAAALSIWIDDNMPFCFRILKAERLLRCVGGGIHRTYSASQRGGSWINEKGENDDTNKKLGK